QMAAQFLASSASQAMTRRGVSRLGNEDEGCCRIIARSQFCRQSTPCTRFNNWSKARESELSLLDVQPAFPNWRGLQPATFRADFDEPFCRSVDPRSLPNSKRLHHPKA